MWFEMAYTVLGGLGLLFFGIKYLSESLQAVTGTLIRQVIGTLTKNRLMAVGVGAFVTILVQSSSITTVMVVGFVNAGLMDLVQAIGIIFGANIGTTVTGWIIAIKVGKYGLLFIGLGIFPYLFAKRNSFRQMGRVLVSLGFIFIGLKAMSGAFKPLRGNDSFLSIMQYFSADSIWTLLACVAIGALLTFVIQSSSAMLGVTIALAAAGAISFQTAAALVMGENIGTTITAQLAAVGTNTNARCAARAHGIFNVLGVLVLIPFFWNYLELVDYLVSGPADALADDGTKPYVGAHIAAAHTLFNVIAVCVFLPLLHTVAKVVIRITPAKKKKEAHHLRFLPGTTDIAPALGLGASGKQIRYLFELTQEAFDLTHDYLLDKQKNSKKDRIFEIENISDVIQTELTVFLCKMGEGKMTSEEASLSYALIRAADELESVTDYCVTLVQHQDRLIKQNEKISSVAKGELKEILTQLKDVMRKIDRELKNGEIEDLEWEEVYASLNGMKENIRQVRKNNRKRLHDKTCSPIGGLIFNEMLNGSERLRAHLKNMLQSLERVEIEEA